MAGARCAIGSLVVCIASLATLVSAQTPAPADGSVVLPVDEYRELRMRALGAPPPDAGPPVDAVLTRIDYDLQTQESGGQTLVGRALLTVDLLRDGWSRVTIPAGLMIREARLNGQPVALVKGPPPHALLQRLGRHVLELDIVVPVAASAGTESITLPSSPSAISRATLRLPRNGVDLTPTGGFVVDRVETADESRWTLLGRPNVPLALSWRRRVEDQRAELPLRMRSRITQYVGLGEDVSQVTASVRVDVVQGLAREIALSIPPGLVVNQVTGATVADWDVSAGALRVRLLDPASAEVSLVIQGEARTARDGMIAVPLVRMPSAERESGGVALDVVGAGEMSGQVARGLDPVDPAELGDIVAGRQSPSMMAFRLRPAANAEASLSVSLVRYTPQAVLVANVEEARYRALVSEDGRVMMEAKYAVRNNQRSFLKLTLPADATVWTAAVRGRRIHPGKAEADAILLPLDKGRAGEEAPTFVVEVVYVQPIGEWTDKGRAVIPLPVLDLPASLLAFELHYSPRFRVEPQPGMFRAAEDIGPVAEAFRPEAASPLPPAAPFATREDAGAATLQQLVDRFNDEAGGRTVVGALPVAVAFPEFGPSIFLVSELTPEGYAASVELAFRKR